MTNYTLTEGQRVQLLDAQNIGGEHRRQLAIALLQALQPNTQEPIMWRTDKRLNGRYTHADQSEMPTFNVAPGFVWVPLHTHPAPQAKPLTDKQIRQLVNDCDEGQEYLALSFARAIEAAHGIEVKP